MNRRAALVGGVAALSGAGWTGKAAALGNCVPVAPGVNGCQVGLASQVVGAVANRQHATEWCWAASISMVFAYFGHSVSQERIVNETWGGIVNLPGQPGQILQDLNRSWIDDSQRGFVSSGDVMTANAVSAAQDLDNNYPLLLGALGHCMVLTEMDYRVDGYGRYIIDRVIVRDPWPYNPGRRILSPMEFANISFLARVRVRNA